MNHPERVGVESYSHCMRPENGRSFMDAIPRENMLAD